VQLLALQRISQLLVDVSESFGNSHQPQVKVEDGHTRRHKDLILDSMRQQAAAIATPPSLRQPSQGIATAIRRLCENVYVKGLG